MRDVFQQRPVLLAQRHPVIAVHIRNIEPVAITPPDFVENLVPFFDGNAIEYQACCRNSFPGPIALRVRVVEVESRSLAQHHFRSVA